MIKTNSKLLLASTALVSVVAFTNIADAANTSLAISGALNSGTAELLLDSGTDTAVAAGDTISVSGSSLSGELNDADNTTSPTIDVDIAGVTLNIDSGVQGNHAANAAVDVTVHNADTVINVFAGQTVANNLAGIAIDFGGAATAAGTLNVIGDVSTAGTDAIVVGAAVTGNARLNIAGDITGNIDLTNSTVSETIVLTSDSTITGDLIDGNDTTLTVGNATINGTAFTVSTVTVTGNAGANNATISAGTFAVGGNLNTGNDMTVASGATLNVTGTSLIGKDLTVAGTMGQTGAASVTGNLSVTGTYTGAANLGVTANATVSGSLTEGGTFGSNDLTVSNGGNVDVSGASTIGNDLTINAGGSFDATGSIVIANDLVVAGTYRGAISSAVTAGDANISGTYTEAGTFDVNDPNSLLTISGTLNVTGAASASSVTIASGGSATFGSTLGLAGNLVQNGTLSVTGATTGIVDATFGSNSTTDLTADLTATGALSVASGADLTVRNGVTLTAASGSIDNVTLELGTATNQGTVDLGATAINVNTAGFKLTSASGVDLSGAHNALILSSATTAVDAALAPTGNAFYDYTWTENANVSYDLTVAFKTGITAASTLADVASGDNNSSIGAVIGGGSLETLFGEVFARTDTDTALESLSPDVSGGAAAAAIGTSIASTGTISNRLALLRGTDNGRSGMIAGEEMMANRGMWLQAFGTTADQDKRKGIQGYEATSAGLAIGVDSDEVVEGSRVGVAFSYASADVDSDAANNAQTDIDAYQLTAYASHDYANGIYVDGTIGYSWNDNETERTALGSIYKGEYDSNQFSISAEVGKSYDWNNTKVTPFVGFNYINVESDSYDETGNGGGALSISNDDVAAFLISIGSDIEWNIAGKDGSTYKPYLRAKYSYDAKADEVETSSSFLAGGASFASKGADIAKSTLGLGTGVNIITAAGLELTLAYDAEIKQDFLAHTGVLQARWAF